MCLRKIYISIEDFVGLKWAIMLEWLSLFLLRVIYRRFEAVFWCFCSKALCSDVSAMTDDLHEMMLGQTIGSLWDARGFRMARAGLAVMAGTARLGPARKLKS